MRRGRVGLKGAGSWTTPDDASTAGVTERNEWDNRDTEYLAVNTMDQGLDDPAEYVDTIGSVVEVFRDGGFT